MSNVEEMIKRIEILLVEDNPGDVRLTIEALQDGKMHNHLNVAADGEEAIRLASELKPDVIVMDIMMPTMDGVTFLTHIRNDPRYARIPVVVVTAKDLTAAEHDRLATQTLGIVAKGDDLEAALYRALEHVAGRARAEPARASGAVVAREVGAG